MVCFSATVHATNLFVYSFTQLLLFLKLQAFVRRKKKESFLSLYFQGLCGINEHYSFVFLVSWERMKSPELIKVKLTPEEEARLKKGAETLWKVQKELKL